MDPLEPGVGISPMLHWANDCNSELVFQSVVWCGYLSEGIERHNQL